MRFARSTIGRGFLACMLSTSLLGMVSPFAQAQADNEPIATAEPLPKATPAEEKGDASKKMRPLTVSALLQRETMITGVLTDSTLLALKTAFGEASIPLSEVAGVRFPSGQDTSTTVVMLNGDSITGASDVKTITVETEWGTAKINGQNILSLQFVPGLEWQNVNGLNGQRWTLVEAKNPGAATANRGGMANGLPTPAGSLPGNPLNGPQVVPAGGVQRQPATFGR